MFHENNPKMPHPTPPPPQIRSNSTTTADQIKILHPTATLKNWEESN
jgi:hypothetical protein